MVKQGFKEPADVVVRAAGPDDRAWLVEAATRLQEWERQFFDGLLPGSDWAGPYVDDMLQRTAAMQGGVALARVADRPVGFVAFRVEEDESLEETPDSCRYGYVSDLFVEDAWRGRRIAARLIAHAETSLQSAGVSRLRIAVLVGNDSAVRAYRGYGFQPYLLRLEKPLRRS